MSFLTAFPNLQAVNKTSDATPSYNCIAWALGISDKWWWPVRGAWHPNAPRENTVEAFTIAFSEFGYQPCDNQELEVGYEKIVLFCQNGLPTHAARLLDNGHWTSKLGEEIDISHQLYELEGPAYGDVSYFYRRETRN